MTKCWYRLNLNVENAISKDWQFPKKDVFWDEAVIHLKTKNIIIDR
jgi:hypothetical protein